MFQNLNREIRRLTGWWNILCLENSPNDIHLALEPKILDDHISQCDREIQAIGESGSDGERVKLSGRASGLVLTMLTNGVWAQVEVGDEHLRLFSEHNAQGIQASVYNFKTKTWIAPSEGVDDIEHGKDRAQAIAKEYLKRVTGLELPPVQWKESRDR